ncbi:MAG: hypothetical protein O8C64_16125 [Candidatus Methanoperedens sp.]|nr:hypothetical protein [Candidatus Methanoperedens sp.]MCZ7405154.1 hypothetical protein [Candidatus Methanoperedens sp.]
MIDYNKIEIAILKHLYKHAYIGKRHTPFENALKGIPKHLRGEAKDSLEIMIKIGLVLPYPTGHGLDVRINPERVDEVKRIIGVTPPP